uniref:MADF domain-containing protein n=1 Tax=Heliothis virescens TaxID=7102 RepID=A0A2A4JSL0_HELVI
MSMSDVEWSGDLSIRLVEEYRRRPELWDNGHSLYRVQSAKYEAWADIARIFECDIADLRKKLNSIFASYRREKAKIRSGGRSTWFLYSYLRFLPNHLESPSEIEVIVGTPNDVQISQNPESARSDESSDDDDDQEDSHITIKQEPVIETYVAETHVTSAKRRALPKERLPKRKYRLNRPLLRKKLVKEPDVKDSLDSRLLETLKLLRKSDLSKKKDECDSFGEYIAVSLRKHDERTRSMIKQAINNILFEQEMKKYSTGQYTVVLSGVDENPLVIGDGDDK